jgi:hypothetical protein
MPHRYGGRRGVCGLDDEVGSGGHDCSVFPAFFVSENSVSGHQSLQIKNRAKKIAVRWEESRGDKNFSCKKNQGSVPTGWHVVLGKAAALYQVPSSKFQYTVGFIDTRRKDNVGRTVRTRSWDHDSKEN